MYLNLVESYLIINGGSIAVNETVIYFELISLKEGLIFSYKPFLEIFSLLKDQLCQIFRNLFVHAFIFILY